MSQLKLKSLSWIAFCVLFSGSFRSPAVEFEPGVGVGLEYTDNATLSADNQVDDLIVVGYLGASLADNEGSLVADITAALNHHRYTKDTFNDQRYFNLGASAGWEMIRGRFNWLLRNYYTQRPIVTSDPNTPDNIQDANAFTFGADILFPISARQTFSLLPEYSSFYYELQANDNQQYSLVGNWNYELNSLTNVGLVGSIRRVDYKEPLIVDVNFASIFFAFSRTHARYDISTNLGSTYVERDNGQNTVEFAGNLNWLLYLTSHSRIRTFISTDLTDSSRGAFTVTVDPELGDPSSIQVTTDVVRTQVATLTYLRQDSTLESSFTGQLRNLNYSESLNDRRIFLLGAAVRRPLTALTSSGILARYNNTEYLDIDRIDDTYRVSGNLLYQMSRNLRSSIDLTYRNRDSTVDSQNISEWSVYVTLTYGFGQPLRPTRVGVF